MNGTDCGVLYVATGRDYLDLACQSAASLRRVEPRLAIDLMTDAPVPGDAPFDRVGPIPDGCRRPKIAGMLASRFDRTLFLDADTLVLGPVADGFGLLDRFDLAIAHDVRRSSALVQAGLRADLPESFPQHNSGVMFYRRSAAMTAFLRDWGAAYDAGGGGRDQLSLKDLLWESDLRFWVLPPEWNLRRVTELDAWEPLDAVPRILHSHQLLRHLRHGDDRVETLSQVLELERAALAGEWAALAEHAGALPEDAVARFVLARDRRRE